MRTKTATQVLAEKIDDKNLIVEVIIPKLDAQVREEFGLSDEPISLDGDYGRGDADERKLEEIAGGYRVNVYDLLDMMDDRLVDLAEEYNPQAS